MERYEKVVEALLRYGDAEHGTLASGQGAVLVTIGEPIFKKLLASEEAFAAYVASQEAKRDS
ncbi:MULTISPECIES: hypothetical protein [Rhodopirellula]|uniref:hypothetical protein n=1 Tax=Rhodopirellula TaxID=265488 RepID=UPI00257DE2A3|nr:hypothetical protein [Rhodopirellula sp. UBA1907]|tara:strand:- start:1209 stop:1394 length:186 start_codon:yes stop_codon:yes gene_type:complete